MSAINFAESIGNHLLDSSPKGILLNALFGLGVVIAGAVIYLVVSHFTGGPSNLIARLRSHLSSTDENGARRPPEEDPYFHEGKNIGNGNTEM